MKSANMFARSASGTGFSLASRNAFALLALAIFSLALSLALGQGKSHFSFFQPFNDSLLYSPAMLPFAAALFLIARPLFPAELEGWAMPTFGLFLFFLLPRSLPGSILLFSAQILLFGLERALPRRPWANTLLVLLGLLYLLVPLLTAQVASWGSESFLGTFSLFHEGFLLRTFSWILFRRLYCRNEWASFKEYLEYFFSPFFFLMPNLLNLVTFSYFHEQKNPAERSGTRMALATGAWGLLLMFAYSGFRAWAFDPIIGPFLWKRGVHFDSWFLLGGFLSMLMILAHHTAAMAFQVSVAKLLGYELRYDMNYPLLARSPMELWRRNHNYTRQYLLENAMRPISIALLRRRVPKRTAFLLSASAGYGAMTLVLLGWKPFHQGNTVVSSIGMAVFFALTVFPSIWMLSGNRESHPKSRWARILAGIEPLIPLKQWTALDYVFCLGTILLVSLAKAAIGALRVIFEQRL